MEIQSIFLLIVGVTYIFATNHYDDSKDPLCKRCTCRGTKVKCQDLRYFPTDFPPEVTDIKFITLNVERVPFHAFQNLINLERLSFNRSNIGVFQGCTFHGLPKLKELLFESVVIKDIEKFTFSDLEGNTRVDFFKCHFTSVMPFAFSNIHNISQFTIRNSTIFNFKESSFYNISNIANGFSVFGNDIRTAWRNSFTEVGSIGNVEFNNNEFVTMGCGSVDSFISRDNRLQFNDNRLICDCGLAWIRPKLGLIMGSGANFPETICTKPANVAGQTVLMAAMSGSESCEDETRRTSTACADATVTFTKSTCAKTIKGHFIRHKTNANPSDNDDDDDDNNSGIKITFEIFNILVPMCILFFL